MKNRFDIDKFVTKTKAITEQSFTNIKETAIKAASETYSAGKVASQTIKEALDNEDTKAAITKAKDLGNSAKIGAEKLTGQVIEKAKSLEANHEVVADRVESVSMGLGITSGAVAAGAALATPTGLSAIGVALGVTSAPLIITVAPAIMAASTVVGVISGGTYFYSKWKTKKQNQP